MTRRQIARENRGFFAIGIWHPKTEKNVGSLWRAAWLYRAAFIFTVGSRYQKRQASDTVYAWKQIPLLHFTDIDDLENHLPHSAPLIGVELGVNSKPLHQFTHPRMATYLLGAEDYGLSTEVMEKCHDLVSIESGHPFSMNVACAGSILLYDRYIKSSYSPF